MSDEIGSCLYCGGWHAGTCPLVKAVEYYPDGTVKRVEFHEQPPALESYQPVKMTIARKEDR